MSGLLSTGTVIDRRYRIDAEIKAGGMGRVYRATHMRLGKTVAIKVMASELAADAEFRRRFEREAQSVADLDHENVIDISDFGEDQHGLYIVMRYVRGADLRTILSERGPVAPRRAVQVIEQVAAALDAAHERGLLHRDVKPGNILVEEPSSRIYLVDFGLVRSSRPSEMTVVVGPRVLGTPPYMAPERFPPLCEDTKSGDIYSLGCVLWELLVGLAPHLPTPAGWPGERDVAPALRAVVERAVDERPERRHASAGDLARAARLAIGSTTAHRLGSEIREAVTVRETRVAPFHTPLSIDLRARVALLCSAALDRVSAGPARRKLERIRDRLSEPLVVAVVGYAGAGKSTLVGALAGRRIGPPAGEPPTWYRELELELTMVETLALGSHTSADQEAMRRAEALLFVIAADDQHGARAALEAFRDRFQSRPSALESIAVLTKSDLIPSLSSAAAAQHTEALRADLRPLVHDVVAVSGLLAVAAAEAAPDSEIEKLRQQAARDLASAGDLVNPSAIAKRLRELSGIDALRERVDAVKLRADMLKADAAMVELEAVAWEHGLDVLRNEIDAIRLEQPLLELLRTYDRCAGGEIELDDEMLAELERLLAGRTLAERLNAGAHASPDELRKIARQRASAWRTWSGGASYRGRQVADKIDDVYTQIVFPPAVPAGAPLG